jgi:hypothetical protein
LLSNLLVLALAVLAAWAPLRHGEDSSQALLAVARELAPLRLGTGPGQLSGERGAVMSGGCLTHDRE